jgi:zinc protease
MLKKMFLYFSFLFLFLNHTEPIAAGQDLKSNTAVYSLPNGLQVILVEKHANPMVACMIYVNAGSKYETDFNNGVTHFLEHLLFDGTKTKTRTDITEGIKSKGGYINAFTSRELTCFMVLMPKEFIGEGVEVQSDMLFNSIFPDTELAKERKIVTEEIKMNEDNVDYQVEKFFNAQAYKGAPYARPVLGYENIISTISKEEIIDYYHTYYEPNNMICLVIGDFETEAMKDLLDKYYGEIPARPLPKLAEIHLTPPAGQEVKYKEVEAENTYVNFCFNGPRYDDPDYYAFDVLTQILNSGETSPLVKVLTEGTDPLATSVSAYLETQKEFTTLNLGVITNSPDKVDGILESTVNVLVSMGQKTPEKEQLERVLVSAKTHRYYQEEKLLFYGMEIAPALVTCGWDFLETYIDQLEKVTPQKAQTVASKYFSAPKYIATVVKPKKENPSEEKSSSSSIYKKEVLPNGLTVIVKSNPDSKVLGINILGKNRSAMEPEGKTGIADFTNRMLLKGTTSRSAEQIAKDLASIGAEITVVDNPWIPYDDVYTTHSFTFIKFQTIDEYTEKGIGLLSDLIINSNFPEEDIGKTQKEMMSILGRDKGSTHQTCRNLFYATLFKDHPYGKPIMGEAQSIGAITRDDLIEFHKKFYSPNNMIITVCTNMPPDQMINKIKAAFSNMDRVDFPEPQIPAPNPLSSPLRAEKEMEKEQIYIYLGQPMPGIQSPDAPALALLNSILSSRLGLNLREVKGLAYSVGSSVHFDKDFGWFIASIGTRPQNYQEALDGILGEMKKIKEEEVSPDELDKAKNGIWGSMLFYRLSRINQTYYMGVNEFKGAGYDYDDKYIESLRKVTIDQVKGAAEKYLDTNNYVLAVVGKI